MLRIRSTCYFKPNSSEQPTMAAKFQLPLAGQFMNVKPRTLHVAALALRIVPTRTLTAHESDFNATRLPQSATHIIAKSAAPVPSDCGLGLVPTHTFVNCPVPRFNMHSGWK